MRTLIALLFLLSSPLTVAAQLGAASDYFGANLSFEIQPRHPQPGEPVTLSLNDYSGGYYGAQLEWYQDNSLIPNSTNQRTITITAPAAGEKSTIALTLKKSDGGSETLKTVLAPLYTDIIVEPQTHVPSFYRGRALPSAGSMVSLTALIGDGTMMSTNLIYTWRVNGEVLEGGPLRGGNKVSFKTPQDREIIIALDVTTPAGESLTSRSIFIPSVRPELHFYEVNTLYGIESKTLAQPFSMIGNTMTVQAEPYYLDSSTFNFPSISDWKINGGRITNGSNNPYELTLEKTGYTGKATIEFHVRNTASLLQGAQGEFKLEI